MTFNKMTFSVQRSLILVSAAQTAYLAFSYVSGSRKNSFAVLEGLFDAQAAADFTQSGCWQAMMPFVASTYISLTIISVMALFFRPGRELRLMLLGLSSVHLVMAIVRLTIGPIELYQDGAALGASSFQFVMAALMAGAAMLPYATRQR